MKFGNVKQVLASISPCHTLTSPAIHYRPAAERRPYANVRRICITNWELDFFPGIPCRFENWVATQSSVYNADQLNEAYPRSEQHHIHEVFNAEARYDGH